MQILRVRVTTQLFALDVAFIFIAAAPVATVEAYRAHSFKFWEFISATISDIEKGDAKMSSPVAITN